MSFKFLHSSNTPAPILLILSGKFISSNLLQLENVETPISSTPLSIFVYENETTLKMMIQDQGNGLRKKIFLFYFKDFIEGKIQKAQD